MEQCKECYADIEVKCFGPHGEELCLTCYASSLEYMFDGYLAETMLGNTIQRSFSLPEEVSKVIAKSWVRFGFNSMNKVEDYVRWRIISPKLEG